MAIAVATFLIALAIAAGEKLHIEPATVALSGAAVGLLVTTVKLEDALAHLEWTTLFFFVGLFVMVGALEATGAIGHVADAVKDATGRDRTAELIGITWIAALGSAVVDNIPFTTAMIPVVKELQQSAGAGGDPDRLHHLSQGRHPCDDQLPALPAVEADGRFAGIFGEREFMAALFPGYMSDLRSAALVGRFGAIAEDRGGSPA